jgi:hypothetical protein
MSEPQYLDGDDTARGITNENELRTFTVEFEIGDNSVIDGLDIDSVMDDIDDVMRDVKWCCGIKLIKTN